MKSLLLITLISISFIDFGQTVQQAYESLKDINTVEEADALETIKIGWQVISGKDITENLFEHIDSNKVYVGNTFKAKPYDDDVVIKILKKDTLEVCKVRYIYFDSNNLSPEQIDSTQTAIIEKYKNGASFQSLVEAYNIDGNPTGNFGWFYKGVAVPEFDEAVRSQKKDAIFKVDVLNHGYDGIPPWHYVVLKTHDNKLAEITHYVQIKINEE